MRSELVQLKWFDYIRIRCPRCKGSGRRHDYDLLPCKLCDGYGVVYMHTCWLQQTERERAPQEAVPAGA